jgi:hypothetical protein
MTYKNHRNVLIQQLHLYLLYMHESRDPDDIRKIDEELHRLKNEIAAIECMTESQQHEQRKTLMMTLESRMKFI